MGGDGRWSECTTSWWWYCMHSHERWQHGRIDLRRKRHVTITGAAMQQAEDGHGSIDCDAAACMLAEGSQPCPSGACVWMRMGDGRWAMGDGRWAMMQWLAVSHAHGEGNGWRGNEPETDRLGRMMMQRGRKKKGQIRQWSHAKALTDSGLMLRTRVHLAQVSSCFSRGGDWPPRLRPSLCWRRRGGMGMTGAREQIGDNGEA